MGFIIFGLILLAVFGEPLFIIIGGAAFASFYFALDIHPATLFTDFYRLTTMPVFVAIPLFIFSGYLLAESRVPEKMLRFTNALLGWIPGGLCLVALIACSIFTAFTGASAITIVAIGTLLYPAFLKDNYPENFALGLITTSGSLGTLFMPCLPLILYGVIASQQTPLNVEDMFIAGLLPGVLLLVLMWIYSFPFGLKYTRRQGFAFKELMVATVDIIWELPLPFFIIGGILAGLFSAPEAAAVAAIYVLLVEMFITRDMTAIKLIGVIRRSMIMNGSILIIVGMALGLTDVFVTLAVPDKIFAFICNYVTNKYVFLLLLNFFLLFVGMSMDIFSACAIVVPIVVPIALKYGVDPVHLGIIFLANLELGFVTPPIGMSLFISSIKFNKSFPTILRSVVPFFIILLIGLLLITYVPELSLFLLRFTAKKNLIDPMDLL
ncbi:TRAP transporter large permease [Desulfosudis oleivorans]|uniref:TRAP dicarboxylate transporter, DctM subunit n=1 Tax=Desulfosudis oleivorans (strain DSM 6200 / JCM 39069 / Hxd3) TaxID=96561 RepID=A8ZZK6_DESOH|nr:TRAP transporter large permease subunit [Desulfosudis oleivorans]ABW68878.1 TRAP dicarboxylate transporter, DctM subunit [Desulfosudis oleivorans Hxd3]